MSKLRVLDLFSGIGGFSLGLERTGKFETTAFCEKADYQRRVLERHWPIVPCADDVTTMEFPDADVITAGFPCQEISGAGKRTGLAGKRSGLWREVVRAVRMVGPRYVVLENVEAILVRGVGTVLGDLAEAGYDAEWDCVSAAEVGAPHDRPRWFSVAYPSGIGRGCILCDWLGRGFASRPEWPTDALDSPRSLVAWLRRTAESLPPFRRDADGLSAWSSKRQLEAAGNAVLPQFPELLGKAILAAEGRLV